MPVRGEPSRRTGRVVTRWSCRDQKAPSPALTSIPMIDSDEWSDGGCGSGTPWRRALDVLDDYDRGGALTEGLADDLVNELAGLGPRNRPGRPRRTGVPQPSRPASTPVLLGPRPRLTLVHGAG